MNENTIFIQHVGDHCQINGHFVVIDPFKTPGMVFARITHASKVENAALVGKGMMVPDDLGTALDPVNFFGQQYRWIDVSTLIFPQLNIFDMN